MKSKAWTVAMLIQAILYISLGYVPLIEAGTGKGVATLKRGLRANRHHPMTFVKASDKPLKHNSLTEVEPMLYKGEMDEGSNPVFEPLISKGDEALLGRFPFVASLQILWNDSSLYHICGATLVAPDAAITAAHCLVYWGSYDHHLVLGVRSLSQGGEVDVRVGNVTIHPNNNPLVYDIAVLHLEERVPLSHNVQIIRMANPSDPAFDNLEECTLSGWGQTEYNGTAPTDVLRYGTLRGITNNQCRQLLRIFNVNNIFSQHKCAWGWPHSACQGDSGAPLVCDGLLVGITVGQVGGCTGCFPTIFQRVSVFYNWVVSVIS